MSRVYVCARMGITRYDHRSLKSFEAEILVPDNIPRHGERKILEWMASLPLYGY